MLCTKLGEYGLQQSAHRLSAHYSTLVAYTGDMQLPPVRPFILTEQYCALPSVLT